MEFDFADRSVPEVCLPDEYEFVSWNLSHLNRHARTKYRSFVNEMDSQVFQCLGSFDGCLRLMEQISGLQSFLPAATWLIRPKDDNAGRQSDCGTIQGLANSRETGSIQNVGVTPEHRGQGLGRALVVKALQGFLESGLRRVYLDATAENVPAVELYRSIGFRLIRTTYRQVTEPAES